MKNYKVFLLVALCLMMVLAACTNGSFDVVRNNGGNGGNGGGNGGGGENIPEEYEFPLFMVAAGDEGDEGDEGDKGAWIGIVVANQGVTEEWPDLEYSIDDCKTWESFKFVPDDEGDPTVVHLENKGDRVFFRGKNKTFSSRAVQFKFMIEGQVAAGGNIMSLLDPDLQLKEISTPYCFAFLFEYCTQLTRAPILPATTLAERCYLQMFSNCTSLTTAPALPATQLKESCYQGMFSGCSALKNAPALRAEALAQSCYDSMFYGCTSLEEAPALPATTLQTWCYQCMFRGCTSLTETPVLEAPILAQSCYIEMFFGCSSLSKVTCLATDISATNCTAAWLGGVAREGIFIKDAEMGDWSEGSLGIPTGWETEDYTP